MTSRILSNEECEILRYDLNHGIATNLKESDILTSAESVWNQITKYVKITSPRNHTTKLKEQRTLFEL